MMSPRCFQKEQDQNSFRLSVTRLFYIKNLEKINNFNYPKVIAMKKIGILGGTFNPPHIGHLIIANEVLDALSLDEIRYMPNYVPPHKEGSGEVTAYDRMAMLEQALREHPCFYIEKSEMERKGTSYTYDSMKMLVEKE